MRVTTLPLDQSARLSHDGMKFVAGENGRNSEKVLPSLRLVYRENHLWRLRRELGTPAVGGEQVVACETLRPELYRENLGDLTYSLSSFT